MFNNKDKNEIERLKKENESLKEENLKNKRLINTQQTLIKDFEKRKKEYQRIIITKAVSLNRFLKKQEESRNEEEEEDEL